MIIVENILKEIFEQLPPAVDSNDAEFAVKFHWGGEKDLNPYLLKIAGNKYPLLWLVEGEDNADDHSHTLRRHVKLFIAKQSSDRDALNPTVWDSEFENILNPILKNVITALNKSGVTMIVGGNYKIARRANYTEADSNKSKTIDCWNVIVLTAEVEFEEKADGTPNCIKQIIF